MSRGMKVGLIIGVLALAGGGGIAYSMNKKKNAGTEVRMEQVGRRELVSAVTASGKIEPQTSVDISADITGRIIEIAVEEGDVVRRGQFLIQIDPAQYQAAVSRAEGVVSSTQATLLQVRANRDQAERAWKRADQLSRASLSRRIRIAADDRHGNVFELAHHQFRGRRQLVCHREHRRLKNMPVGVRLAAVVLERAQPGDALLLSPAHGGRTRSLPASALPDTHRSARPRRLSRGVRLMRAPAARQRAADLQRRVGPRARPHVLAWRQHLCRHR